MKAPKNPIPHRKKLARREKPVEVENSKRKKRIVLIKLPFLTINYI